MNHPKSPDLEVEEVEVSPEVSSFGEILSRFEESHRPETTGQSRARDGRVVAVTPEFVFLDIGLKMEGRLPVEAFRNKEGAADVKPGDIVIATITGRDEDGYYQLSKVKVERPKDWASLEKAFAEKHTIGGMVTAMVKGGLTVDVGVRAFLPASKSGTRETAELETLVGQEIRCKIIKLDVSDEDVVVDRRVVLEEEEAQARQKAFEALQEGSVVEGKVRSLTQFGAFVDLGGFDGLLHVTDMSWGRVSKPSDVVSTGDTVTVKILKVDPAARRISLGLKQLSPDPWSLAAGKYSAGQRVRGRVTRALEFGAFVELEPGIEGLIHLSELSWSRKIRKPEDVVKPGETVEAVILGVNAEDKRIALGLKQALGDPWDGIETKLPAGAVVEGPVVSLTNFGAFVELGDGLEGMIHIGDVSREKRLKHPKEELTVGQRVRAMVLEIDREKRRIRLGMKQLEPTTMDEYIAEHKCGDMVSGRIMDVQGDRATVEMGEGVRVTCPVPQQKAPDPAPEATRKPDISTLTAMLSAKWKQGKGPAPVAAKEPLRAGQVRTFRILSLDPARKLIEVELAG